MWDGLDQLYAGRVAEPSARDTVNKIIIIRANY